MRAAEFAAKAAFGQGAGNKEFKASGELWITSGGI